MQYNSDGDEYKKPESYKDVITGRKLKLNPLNKTKLDYGELDEYFTPAEEEAKFW